MARVARVVIPGCPHHVVQRGVRSLRVFFSDADRNEYLSLLKQSAERWELSVWAWCLMSTHVHLLVVPRHAESMARAIGEAHRQYTRRVNLRQGVRGHLFQERFHSYPIQKDRHLLAVARYIEMNPVRAHLVSRPQEYRWSSAPHHLLGVADPLVVESPLEEMTGSWAAFLSEAEAANERRMVELHLRTGRPYGERTWCQRLEKRLGRALLPRKRGWPKGRPRSKKSAG